MMRLILLTALTGVLLPGQVLSVIQQKTLWPDATGTVEITSDGVRYTADDDDDGEKSREWTWLDIQYFDRIGPMEFTILTYEDQKWRLGQDREFHFTITEGELTDELVAMISAGLNRPLTDRIVPESTNAPYIIPVKHLHAFGGCQGELEFTADAIYYRTDDAEDSRRWLLGRDVQSVWSGNPYQLEIHVYDNNRREFSRSRVYRFDLKQRLDPEFYRSLKLKFYDLDTTHRTER